jgi:poly(A) polymerase
VVIDRLRQAGIKSVPTGIAHGTVTAVLRGRPVEITTLRRDVSTDGRRATVAFTDDWQEDAARRDFTINALSANPADGALFDYFGGLADLEARRVRFIGEPLQRIAEDHLRILRFFRFHARFGHGDPDAPAVDACRARANDLMALSRERIADELLKLLAVPNPLAAVRLMVSLGILKPVLPEIEEAGVARLALLLAREASFGQACDPVRRLAALLPAEPALAASVAARLRLSNKIGKRLTIAVEPDPPSRGDARILAYGIGLEGAVDRLLLAGDEADLGARLAALDGWTKPRLPIGGGDLIAMGIAAGPDVSRLLQAIEAEWAGNGFDQDRPSALALARRHADQWLRSK